MMKLKLWLVKRNISYPKFASKIGVTKIYIRQLMCGACPFTEELAKKIEDATGGDIRADSLYKKLPKKKRKPRRRLKQLDFEEMLEKHVKIAKPGELPEGWGKFDHLVPRDFM